jgi:hypothetical protein
MLFRREVACLKMVRTLARRRCGVDEEESLL